MDAGAVYRRLDELNPYHAGSATAGLLPVPVRALHDPSWVAAEIALSSERYPAATLRALGVLWWYSASHVVLAPTAESTAADLPPLDASTTTLYKHADGRVLAARATATTPDPGPPLRDVLAGAIAVVAETSGATERHLWSITTDSLGNRTLWAGGTPAHAEALAQAIGPELPTPRFIEVHGRPVVRRASCCLLYTATTAEKCASCPRQTPEERQRRVERALGH